MVRQSIQTFVFLFVICGLCTPAFSERRIITLDEQSDWNAVGRVNKGGFNTASTCTGTLIAPDLVITAAHCVPVNNPSPERMAEHKFVAGWNRGEYAAARDFAEVYLHPDYVRAGLSMANVHLDVALVRLASPIPEDVVRPMVLGQFPAGDVRLAFVGYRNERVHAPEFVDDCPHVPSRDNVATLGCPVFSGNSGSPVLDLTPLGPRIVGVIPAKIPLGAIAVTFQDWMEPHLADLR